MIDGTENELKLMSQWAIKDEGKGKQLFERLKKGIKYFIDIIHGLARFSTLKHGLARSPC